MWGDVGIAPTRKPLASGGCSLRGQVGSCRFSALAEIIRHIGGNCREHLSHGDTVGAVELELFGTRAPIHMDVHLNRVERLFPVGVRPEDANVGAVFWLTVSAPAWRAKVITPVVVTICDSVEVLSGFE